jgi:thiol-disulfide isomerase/thioredoxin
MRKLNNIINKLFVVITIGLAVVLLILPGCKQQSADTQNQTRSNAQTGNEPAATPPASITSDTDPQQNAIQVTDAVTQKPSTGLDFTFTDIKGNKHNLSDYRGKKVMIIFWATWCPPCKAEIPDLITLRKKYTEDQLAMIAISDEPLSVVKPFVQANKMNYTIVATDSSKLPAPLNKVEFIPTSFYLDSNGEIKGRVEGLNTLGQIEANLEKVK